MSDIFEIIDKTNRKIKLTLGGWKHISTEHSEVKIEEIKSTLINPVRIQPSKYNPEQVNWYYRYNKNIKRYLLVAVRYLNGEGFIITAYYVRNLR